jgi:hypothetical protein
MPKESKNLHLTFVSDDFSSYKTEQSVSLRCPDGLPGFFVLVFSGAFTGPDFRSRSYSGDGGSRGSHFSTAQTACGFGVFAGRRLGGSSHQSSSDGSRHFQHQNLGGAWNYFSTFCFGS